MNRDSEKNLLMRKLAKALDHKHDPTTASVVGVERNGGVKFDDIHLEEDAPHRRTGVFKDSLGRSYFEINKFASDQMLLAKILKGIMPISDVIYNNGQFLSYKMPMNAISTGTEETSPVENLGAYSLLLEHVFGDFDHRVPVSHNVVIHDNAASMFDLHLFGEQFWLLGKINMKASVTVSEPLLINSRARYISREILSKLRSVLDGGAGLIYLRAIIKHIKNVSSQVPEVIKNAPGRNTDAKITSFRNEVLKRMKTLEEIINEHDAVQK